MSSTDSKLNTGIWPQNPCILCFILILMVQRDVCTNFFSILRQEYKVVSIKEKIAKILRFSDFKSGASKV